MCMVAWSCNGMESHSRSCGHGFDSRLCHYHGTTLGKFFTPNPCASDTKQCKLVLAKAGKQKGNYVTHPSQVRGLAASAGVWLRALNWRSAPHQWALAHGQLLLFFYCYCNISLVYSWICICLLMHCRHVDVRTNPQNCFVFTLRTHPAVQPGTIAFNAPQVWTLSKCDVY